MNFFPFDPFGSSFYSLLSRARASALDSPGAEAGRSEGPGAPALDGRIPHGTTVLAIRCRGGAVIAGDRMATEGFSVSARRIEKVYQADEHSVIAVAGAAGACIEMARLFQTELQHYEKLEGTTLSTEGKANKLAQMIKGNLPMALQGLVVIPIFVSYDLKRGEGRIFKYDVAGGQYEETEFYATGSGGRDARNTIKKFFKPELPADDAVRVAIEALYDAAEEDVATGGPDLVREIFPTVKRVTAEGLVEVPEEKIKAAFTAILEDRRRRHALPAKSEKP